MQTCWPTACVFHTAGETTALIHSVYKEAAALGFSAQELLQAAVDSISKAVEGSAPSNESAPAQRLRLLVSPCLSGCLAMHYSLWHSVLYSWCLRLQLLALQQVLTCHGP
jgi:hypothetical protein